MAQNIFRIMAYYLPFSYLRSLFLNLGGVKIGSNSMISRGVFIKGNVKIGKNVKIKSFSEIEASTIGEGVVIDKNASVNYSDVGEDSWIQTGAILRGYKESRIKIGKGVVVGYNWYIDGIGGVEVEDNVNLGSHCGGIFSHSGLKNRILGNSFRAIENLEKKPVKIETCSWLGGKVTIQPGITIGHHCAVMPNSSVISDVPPYTMVGGVPAKPLKRIKINGDKVSFKSI